MERKGKEILFFGWYVWQLRWVSARTVGYMTISWHAYPIAFGNCLLPPTEDFFVVYCREPEYLRFDGQ